MHGRIVLYYNKDKNIKKNTMAVLTNSDIIKGSKLMVFVGNQAIGFATNHTLSLTTNTTQVSTKDSGDYPSTIAQNITFEATAENLYSDAGEATYMNLMLQKQPVKIKFAAASNYNNTDEKGIINGAQGHQAWTAGTSIVEGDALITSLNVNAPAGDNATLSVTFTGTGALTEGQNG